MCRPASPGKHARLHRKFTGERRSELVPLPGQRPHCPMLRIFLFALLSVLPASACIWDRDTLRDEAKGKLDTVKAITGWFDRYPARYCEMRLDRVTKELEKKPDALDLYDDAGVACSRLGRHDEAIAWMTRKGEVLASKRPEETKEERYRYYSNLGTFLRFQPGGSPQGPNRPHPTRCRMGKRGYLPDTPALPPLRKIHAARASGLSPRKGTL